jgi:hypothetical protein
MTNVLITPNIICKEMLILLSHDGEHLKPGMGGVEFAVSSRDLTRELQDFSDRILQSEVKHMIKRWGKAPPFPSGGIEAACPYKNFRMRVTLLYDRVVANAQILHKSKPTS